MQRICLSLSGLVADDTGLKMGNGSLNLGQSIRTNNGIFLGRQNTVQIVALDFPFPNYVHDFALGDEGLSIQLVALSGLRSDASFSG